VDDNQCRSYGIAGCWNTTSACERIWQDQEFVLVKLLPGEFPPFFSYRELSQLVHSLIRYCKTTKDHLVCPGPCALNDKFILTKIHSGSVCVGPSDQGGRRVWSTKNWWRLLFDTITWMPFHDPFACPYVKRPTQFSHIPLAMMRFSSDSFHLLRVPIFNLSSGYIFHAVTPTLCFQCLIHFLKTRGIER
jgi:hypothetical protein